MNKNKKIGLEYWKKLRKEWTQKPNNFVLKPKPKINQNQVLEELEDYPDCPSEYSPHVPLIDMVLILQTYWKNQEEAENLPGKL